ncbi:MAG: response regulator [Bacteroidales bacterium]
MRLLISERSPILRKRLTRLFSDLGYISLVAFVDELNDVQKIALEEKPDVIVIDIDFPGRNNLKILQALKNDIKHPKLLVLTETIELKYIRQFQNSGVDMVFNKKDDLNKFIGYLNQMELC